MVIKKSTVNDLLMLLLTIIISIIYLIIYPFLIYFNSDNKKVNLKEPRVIVITGASSGIGHSLACEYSKQNGIVLGLIGRDQERLNEIKEELTKTGAIVEIGEMDITDKVEMESWLLSFDDKYNIDIVIANAGTSESMLPELSEIEKIRQTTNVNVIGTLNTILPLIERFQSRMSGHFVLISSFSIYFNTMASAYTGSKGFISSFGLTLRSQLFEYGINVSTCIVGFVKTPLLASGIDEGCYHLLCPITPEQAASSIIQGVKNNDRLIIFPFIAILSSVLNFCYPQNLKDAFNNFFLNTFKQNIKSNHTNNKKVN